MFKEMRGLEYVLEVLRVFHKHPGDHDSKKIYDLIVKSNREASLTYVQKVLPRLVRIGLLNSCERGYSLSRPISDITINMVLEFCDMPMADDPLFKLCDKLKAAVSSMHINEFYDFS